MVVESKMVIITAVLATFATCGLVVLMVWLTLRANKRREEQNKYHVALLETAKAMIEAGAAYKNVPGLIEGMLKIAKAQTIEIVKLRTSIERMTNVVTRPEDRVKALEQPTEEEASQAWDIAQLLAENPGMSADVAAQKIKDNWEVSMVRSGIGIE